MCSLQICWTLIYVYDELWLNSLSFSIVFYHLLQNNQFHSRLIWRMKLQISGIMFSFSYTCPNSNWTKNGFLFVKGIIRGDESDDSEQILNYLILKYWKINELFFFLDTLTISKAWQIFINIFSYSEFVCETIKPVEFPNKRWPIFIIIMHLCGWLMVIIDHLGFTIYLWSKFLLKSSKTYSAFISYHCLLIFEMNSVESSVILSVWKRTIDERWTKHFQ